MSLTLIEIWVCIFKNNIFITVSYAYNFKNTCLKEKTWIPESLDYMEM